MACSSNKSCLYLRTCRFMIGLILLLGTFTMYTHRSSIGMSLICMTNRTAVAELYPNEALDDSPIPASPNSKCVLKVNNDTDKDGPYVWGEETRGYIYGYFFAGYVFGQIPGAIMVQKFPMKFPVLILMFIFSLTTILIPALASASLVLLNISRVISGYCAGIWFPGFYSLISRWFPAREGDVVAPIAYGGMYFGSIVGLPLTGVICESSVGWPLIHYLSGSLGIFFCLLWAIFVYNSPDDHPRIHEDEKQFLRLERRPKNYKRRIPIVRILTSKPIWAYIFTHVAVDSNFYVFLGCIPNYMKYVLKFDITENAGLSTVPYIGLAVGQYLFTYINKCMEDREVFPKLVQRKIFNTFGMLMPSIALVAVSFLQCEWKYYAVALLTVALFFSSSAFCGAFLSPLDLSQADSGMIFAIGNTLSALPGFIGPPLVAKLTPNNNQAEWQRVFYISAAIYCFAALVFLIFGKATEQNWAVSVKQIEIEDECDDSPESEPLKSQPKELEA